MIALLLIPPFALTRPRSRSRSIAFPSLPVAAFINAIKAFRIIRQGFAEAEITIADHFRRLNIQIIWLILTITHCKTTFT